MMESLELLLRLQLFIYLFATILIKYRIHPIDNKKGRKEEKLRKREEINNEGSKDGRKEETFTRKQRKGEKINERERVREREKEGRKHGGKRESKERRMGKSIDRR